MQHPFAISKRCSKQKGYGLKWRVKDQYDLPKGEFVSFQLRTINSSIFISRDAALSQLQYVVWKLILFQNFHLKCLSNAIIILILFCVHFQMHINIINEGDCLLKLQYIKLDSHESISLLITFILIVLRAFCFKWFKRKQRVCSLNNRQSSTSVVKIIVYLFVGLRFNFVLWCN